MLRRLKVFYFFESFKDLGGSVATDKLLSFRVTDVNLEDFGTSNLTSVSQASGDSERLGIKLEVAYIE